MTLKARSTVFLFPVTDMVMDSQRSRYYSYYLCSKTLL